MPRPVFNRGSRYSNELATLASRARTRAIATHAKISWRIANGTPGTISSA